MNTYRRLIPYGLFLLMFGLGGHVVAAQDAQPAALQNGDVSKGPAVVEKPDPLKRRLSDKQRLASQKDMTKELHGEYKKWVDEDVRWIITDSELAAFKALSNDEERDQFIENFWLRRNPNPDSPENEYRDEYYARIAYANERFSAGEPGWKTDRGHIYIAFGKPDSTDDHPSGGQYDRPMSEGGGTTATYPFTVWHYRYLPGVGDNIDIEFVDTCMCGNYEATVDRSAKDALKHTGMGPTYWEANGKADPADRMKGSGLEQLGLDKIGHEMQQDKEFDRLETFTKLWAPPPVQFKDLEEYMVTSKVLTGPVFNFDVRTDYVKVTNNIVIVPLTLQLRNKDITFSHKDGVAIGTVNILGRVSNLTHKPVMTFEDTVKVETPDELFSREQNNMYLYWKSLSLPPGTYKIDIVIKDVNSPDHIGTWHRGLIVPKYDDDKLAASSLILADQMERVPSRDIGQGNFVIGNTYIRPRVSTDGVSPVIFHRTQNLNFWMQVYNLGIDEKSKQNGATIEYQIVDMSTNKSILDTQESTINSASLSKNADQMTLEKSVALASLQPGKYQVTIKVNDGISKQQIAESAPFVVD